MPAMTWDQYAEQVEPVLRDLWPKWDYNDEIATIVHRKVSGYFPETVVKAMRRHREESFDGSARVHPRPNIGTVTELCRKAVEGERKTSWLDRQVREHQEHYSWWAHKGWECPPEHELRAMIQEGRQTPLQLHCRKEVGKIGRMLFHPGYKTRRDLGAAEAESEAAE